MFDAIPGSPTATSYVTVEEATALLVAYSLSHAAWEGNVDLQEQALMLATSLLDERVMWAGYQSTSVQALAWPRNGVLNRAGYLIPNGTIPLALKRAVAEFALQLIASEGVTDTTERLVRSVKVGSIAVEFEPSDVGQVSSSVIPDSVWGIIAFLTELGSTGVTNVPLLRA
jgi:hypothetical protein